ncbi:hypothetical protein GJAV_G00007540 [Gymnothorax javanicus]|nr:hypothetical protein GJAV_G00007540 [Gymnothorax javanicus]
MGLAMFFGCSFITFGPAFAMFMFTVIGSPVRVIILVVGASLWLVSLLLSSLIWYALTSFCNGSDPKVQLRLAAIGAAVAVLIQEALRAASYKLLRLFSHKKTHAALASFVVKGGPPLSLHQKAPVSGLAFGLMSSAFSFANILSLSLGPGIAGIHGESSHFFIISAFQSMIQFCLNICWSLLLFTACESRNWSRAIAVVFTHLLSCILSFLNPLYYASLLLQSVLVVGVVIWAWVEAGGHGCLGRMSAGDRALTKIILPILLWCEVHDLSPDWLSPIVLGVGRMATAPPLQLQNLAAT